MQRHLIILLTLSAASCFGGYKPRTKTCADIEALPGEATILAIGDSMFAWRNQKCRTVPDVVALTLGRKVEHAAVTGARVTGGDHPIEKQYKPHSWQWVILDGGANDLNNECECGVGCDETLDELVSKDGTRGELPSLVDRILQDGPRVVLFGYVEIGKKANYGFAECIAEIDELRRRQIRIAETRERVHFVDGRDVVTVASTTEAYVFDDVHLSHEGALLVGELIAAKILEVEQVSSTP